MVFIETVGGYRAGKRICMVASQCGLLLATTNMMAELLVSKHFCAALCLCLLSIIHQYLGNIKAGCPLNSFRANIVKYIVQFKSAAVIHHTVDQISISSG